VNVGLAVQDQTAVTADANDSGQGEPRASLTNTGSSRPAHQATSPTLADAFLALLLSESGNAAPAGAAFGGSELIEEIATRVSREAAERVIRELAPEIVSQIAERLVREEIARLCSVPPQS
jgi:hypothetical protein